MNQNTTNYLFFFSNQFKSEYFQVMPCNTHDISEFETPVMDKFVPGCKKVSLGNFIDSISCSPDPTIFYQPVSFWKPSHGKFVPECK